MVAGKNLTRSQDRKQKERSRLDGLLKTLIHVMPDFGCAGWSAPLWDCLGVEPPYSLTTSDQK